MDLMIHTEAPVRKGAGRRVRAYIGSVRFFKNLILLGVLLSIAFSTALAVSFQRRWAAAEAEIAVIRASPAGEPAARAGEDTAVPASSGKEPVGEPPGYQALYPDFYAPQPLDASQRTVDAVYLTFDDGPSARTPEVLDILDRQGVKATFFVVGHDDPQSLQWMRDIVSRGHTLGMHSYTHDYQKVYASVEDYLADMYRLFLLIREATGTTPTVFRFPGGSINGYNYALSQALIAEMLRRGFVPCDWNLSAGDATGRSTTAAEIVSAVAAQAERAERGFLLMHDSAPKTTTVAALEPLILRLREMGFSFAALTPETKPVLFQYDDD